MELIEMTSMGLNLSLTSPNSPPSSLKAVFRYLLTLLTARDSDSIGKLPLWDDARELESWSGGLNNELRSQGSLLSACFAGSWTLRQYHLSSFFWCGWHRTLQTLPDPWISDHQWECPGGFPAGSGLQWVILRLDPHPVVFILSGLGLVSLGRYQKPIGCPIVDAIGKKNLKTLFLYLFLYTYTHTHLTGGIGVRCTFCY